MYQLVIFDLDGTLVDSVEDLANAVNHGLGEMDYPTHPLKDFYQFVGNGIAKLCERSLPSTAGSEEVEQLLKKFQTYYEAHCLDCTKPYQGMLSAINRMKENGVKLAVASNKSQDFTTKIVTHFYGADLFDLILGSTETRPKKPSPEIIEEIIDDFQIDPKRVLLIGDSNVDILTAQNAGIVSIGCTWGFRGRAELEQAGATYLADTPDDFSYFMEI